MKKIIVLLAITTLFTGPAFAGAACPNMGTVAKLVAKSRDEGMTLELTKHMLRDTGMSSFQDMANFIYSREGRAYTPAEFEKTVKEQCLKR